MKVRLPQYSMAYDDRGSGTPLLFIHGYPLNRKLWDAQLEGLSDVARVLTIDLRGHGESDSTPLSYTMEILADDCAIFLDMLHITQPIILCGLSMGGYVALAFMRQYASRVAGLVLTATRAIADSPEARINRDKAIEKAKQEGVAVIVDTMLPNMISPETLATRPDLINNLRKLMLNTSLDGVIGDLAGMRDRVDSTSLLPQITIPTLLIFGEEDSIISRDEYTSIQASLPRGRLVTIPGAGHLSNLEKPDQFNRAIKDFITGL